MPRARGRMPRSHCTQNSNTLAYDPKSLIDLAVYATADVITALGERPLAAKAYVARVPLAMRLRVQAEVDMTVQPWVYGSRIIITEGLSSAFLHMMIEQEMNYCEYNARGQRHGYEYTRMMWREGSESLLSKPITVLQAHWRNGELLRETVYSHQMGTTLHIKTYRAGVRHGVHMKWDTDPQCNHHLWITRPYVNGLRHGISVTRNSNGHEWTQEKHRHGVLVETSTRVHIPCRHGIACACTQSVKYVNNIPTQGNIVPLSQRIRYNEIVDDSTCRECVGAYLHQAAMVPPTDSAVRVNIGGRAPRPPWIGEEVPDLVILALSVVGPLVTPEVVARVPRELHWRLQCATPPLLQPAVFGSATWVAEVPPEPHSAEATRHAGDPDFLARVTLVRIWAQHDRVTGCRDGVMGSWVVGERCPSDGSTLIIRDANDDPASSSGISQGGSGGSLGGISVPAQDNIVAAIGPIPRRYIARPSFYPTAQNLACIMAHPDGAIVGQYWWLTDLGQKTSRSMWLADLQHGDQVDYILYTPESAGLIGPTRPALAERNTTSYRHGLRHGRSYAIIREVIMMHDRDIEVSTELVTTGLLSGCVTRRACDRPHGEQYSWTTGANGRRVRYTTAYDYGVKL